MITLRKYACLKKGSRDTEVIVIKKDVNMTYSEAIRRAIELLNEEI